ncbi:hypothetical protein [Vreelandella subglaciescola]|uniref:Uncharacterized protein n=1 Tax=Vreelandella subglaciescola TaxID=29571 RepID=A0A1M7GRI7_9GAMM|nr:hypothetical protein [Halomonas subglaciescola]SHM18880.1 hypothetical protein SAMN05878437_1684 [Halomonas subglaciescola]
MRFIMTLAVLAGLVYGGLYVYYDASLSRAVEERLGNAGLSDVTVEAVDFSPLAPLLTETEVSAEVAYGGLDASVNLRVVGHPLFTDELSLELGGLEALRLGIGGQ